MITLQPETVLTTIAKRQFCTLATASTSGHPHVAGVLYSTVDTTFYVNTSRNSRKARNIANNPNVGVCIPIRRLPIGPPSLVLFQATADMLTIDDPHIGELVERGELKSIIGHGEGDDPDNCFLRITPSGQVHTYGLGMSLRKLIGDPLNAAGQTRFATEPTRVSR